MAKRTDKNGIDAFLGACFAQALASQEWFESCVLILSVDQLRWRPRPGVWAIAECLDHMNRTFAYYLAEIERAIGRSALELRDPASSLALPKRERAFLRRVEPPVRVAMTAPLLLIPVPAVDADLIIDQFPRLRERYWKAVQSASGLDLLSVSISASIHPPVQTLAGVLAFVAAHDRRHIWQVQSVLNTREFPPPLNKRARAYDPEGS